MACALPAAGGACAFSSAAIIGGCYCAKNSSSHWANSTAKEPERTKTPFSRSELMSKDDEENGSSDLDSTSDGAPEPGYPGCSGLEAGGVEDHEAGAAGSTEEDAAAEPSSPHTPLLDETPGRGWRKNYKADSFCGF